MAVAELLDALVETSLALTAALMVVLALRRPLRAVAGAAIAYRLWILVPAMLVAVLVPAATVDLPAAALIQVAPETAAAAPTMVADAPDYRAWAAAAWLAGVLVSAFVLWRQQTRFARRIDVVVPCGNGVVRAVDAIAGLPAAMGVLRPRIVLPADFETRYTPEQQALMHLHERSHIRSGDLQLNGLLALLRCLFWFHPLLHYAARHFRHDQELACDQRVIARHPQARRAYGEAMFKTQLAAQPLPLGCHWGYSHPLKERIEMLKQPLPSLPRWIAGSLAVAGLAAATAFTAWAAQPPRPASTAAVPSSAPSADVVTPVGKVAGQSTASAAAEIQPPMYRRLAPPAYPPGESLQGRVLLDVTVSVDGAVEQVEVARSSGFAALDASARDAVRGWRFEPARQGNTPVAARVQVAVDFLPAGVPALEDTPMSGAMTLEAIAVRRP